MTDGKGEPETPEQVLGLLRIGGLDAVITAMKFAGGRLRVSAELGPDTDGLVAGRVALLSPDGQPVLRGTADHWWGIKPAQSRWFITLDMNLEAVRLNDEPVTVRKVGYEHG